MKVKPINFISNKFTLLTIILCAFSAFGQSDYYWVGGTGNWSNYSSHWATSSGGTFSSIASSISLHSVELQK